MFCPRFTNFASSTVDAKTEDTVRTYQSVIRAEYKPGTSSTVRGVNKIYYHLTTSKKRIKKVLKSMFVANAHGACGYRYSAVAIERINEHLPGGLRSQRVSDASFWNFDAFLMILGKLIAIQSSMPVGTFIKREDFVADTAINPAEASLNTFGVGLPGSVYLNSTSINSSSADVVSILTILCAVCGVNLYIDNLFTDPNTNQWINQFPTGRNFAMALQSTYRYLINFYVANDRVSDGHFWFYKGCNDTISLNAHSDEGSILRKMVRAVKPVAPFGVLASTFDQINSENFASVIPTVFGPAEFGGVVDNYIITFSALLSISDPGTRDFTDTPIGPTVLTAEHLTTVAERTQYYCQLLRNIGGKFADTFALNVSEFFGHTGINSFLRDHVFHGFHELNLVSDSDFENAVIFPYYFIEPSTVLTNLPASIKNRMAYPLITDDYNVPKQLPLFENIQDAVDGYDLTEFVCEWHSLRRTGAAYVYSSHSRVKNGLEFVQIAGVGSLTGGTFNDNVLCSRHEGDTLPTLGSSAWIHGSAGVPHPGELLTTEVVNLSINLMIGNSLIETSERGLPYANNVANEVTLIATLLSPCVKPYDKLVRANAVNKEARKLNKMAMNEAAGRVPIVRKPLSAYVSARTNVRVDASGLSIKLIVNGKQDTDGQQSESDEKDDPEVPVMIDGVLHYVKKSAINGEKKGEKSGKSKQSSESKHEPSKREPPNQFPNMKEDVKTKKTVTFPANVTTDRSKNVFREAPREVRASALKTLTNAVRGRVPITVTSNVTQPDIGSHTPNESGGMFTPFVVTPEGLHIPKDVYDDLIAEATRAANDGSEIPFVSPDATEHSGGQQ